MNEPTTDKVPQPLNEKEDTFKLVVPAIDRLIELEQECGIIFKHGPINMFPEDLKAFNNTKEAAQKLINELRAQALKEFKQKWGLI